jgi:hypothetical protein
MCVHRNIVPVHPRTLNGWCGPTGLRTTVQSFAPLSSPAFDGYDVKKSRGLVTTRRKTDLCDRRVATKARRLNTYAPHDVVCVCVCVCVCVWGSVISLKVFSLVPTPKPTTSSTATTIRVQQYHYYRSAVPWDCARWPLQCTTLRTAIRLCSWCCTAATNGLRRTATRLRRGRQRFYHQSHRLWHLIMIGCNTRQGIDDDW